MTKTRILLVDDHDIVRLGLMTLLNDQPDMEVIGEASTAGEAVKAAEKLQPDVVLMDIRLPGEGGIEATSQAEHHGLQARIASWRANRSATGMQPANDAELAIAKPKPQPVKPPEKFPDMPWKKNKS